MGHLPLQNSPGISLPAATQCQARACPDLAAEQREEDLDTVTLAALNGAECTRPL